MKERIFLFLFLLFILFLAAFVYPRRFVVQKEITPEFGFSFSHRYARTLGLDEQEAYLALLDGLKPKSVRLPVYWQEVEKEQGKFDFEKVDWQVEQAEKRGVPVVLMLGYRSLRRPECFPPGWASNLSQKEFKQAVLSFLKAGVNHFSEAENIEVWQVENEPLDVLCHWCRKLSPSFVAREIEIIRVNDPKKRPILLTFGGEIFFRPFWRGLADKIDIIGVSFYPKVWSKLIRVYIETYKLGILSPRNIGVERGEAIRLGKRFWLVEFQAEPWGPKPAGEISQEEVEKTASPEKIDEYFDIIEKMGGVERIYFWGVEWWYKELLEGRPEMWEKGQEFFSS